DRFGEGVPGGQGEPDRHRLSAEVGGGGGGLWISPPGVAHKLLTGARQADQRLSVARVPRQRGEKPALPLGRMLGAIGAAERRFGARQALIDAKLGSGSDGGAAAGLLQGQDVQLAPNAAGGLGVGLGRLFGG